MYKPKLNLQREKKKQQQQVNKKRTQNDLTKQTPKAIDTIQPDDWR